MQVAVGLRRKPGDHLRDAAGVHVILDDVANEIAAHVGGRCIRYRHKQAPGRERLAIYTSRRV
jgi:hypothetical protein